MPARRVTVALQVGWHDDIFVLPDRAYGVGAADVHYQSETASHAELAVRGTLDEWREGVAAMAPGNLSLMLSIAAAFAGPLLALVHVERLGMHFVGDSSNGKTTSLHTRRSGSRRSDRFRRARASQAIATSSFRICASRRPTAAIAWQSGRRPRASGCAEHCLRSVTASTLGRDCAATCSTNTTTAMSPSRCRTAMHWETHLDDLGITSECHRRIATEGVLLGALIEKRFAPDLVIVSDGAGQFVILLYALCWVYAERLVHELIPLNDDHRRDQAHVRGVIWDLYADLKAYRHDPNPALAPALEVCFDAIFIQRTFFATLNQSLKRLHRHKQKLLLVLKRPDVVLPTNGSESDIRDHVKWRKISGGTRSDYISR